MEEFQGLVPRMGASEEPFLDHPSRSEGVHIENERPICSAASPGDDTAIHASWISDQFDRGPGDPSSGDRKRIDVGGLHEPPARRLTVDDTARQLLDTRASDEETTEQKQEKRGTRMRWLGHVSLQWRLS